MTERQDGGPAFPTAYGQSHPDFGLQLGSEGGMSLRDYFAGQVLAGLVAGREEHWMPKDGDLEAWHGRCNVRWAIYCYDMADAMLEARNRPT